MEAENRAFARTMSRLTSVPNPPRAVAGQRCHVCDEPFQHNEEVWGYGNPPDRWEHTGGEEGCIARARAVGRFLPVARRLIRQELQSRGPDDYYGDDTGTVLAWFDEAYPET